MDDYGGRWCRSALGAMMVLCLAVECPSAEILSAGASPAETPSAEASDLQQLLLEASGEQYATYAELIELMTDGGKLPLFDKRLDLGENEPKKAARHYRKMSLLTERLVKQREQIVRLLDELARQTSSEQQPESPDEALEARRDRSPFQLCSFSPTEIFYAGWKFWRWPENARRRARVDVLGVAFADPQENNSTDTSMGQMRSRIYQQAKERFGDKASLGDSELQFYRNLRDGKLDHIANDLHGNMMQDTSTFGSEYMSIAATQRKRPVDIVYREACKGLEHGINLYGTTATAIVGGGMPGGKKFVEGVDKAKEWVDKAKELEESYGQLQKDIQRVTDDPLGLVQDKIKGRVIGGIKERAGEFVKDRLKLSDVQSDLAQEHIGEAFEEADHYIEFDQKIRDAYQIKDLSKRERRLREIYAAGRKGDWGAVAVAVLGDDQAADNNSSLAVWEKNGRVKITYSPDPVSGGAEVPVPAGVKVVVGAVDKEGTVRAISDEPATVVSGEVVEVACPPGKLRRIVDYTPSNLRRIRDTQPGTVSEGVDWGESPQPGDQPEVTSTPPAEGVDWNDGPADTPNVTSPSPVSDQRPAGGLLGIYQFPGPTRVDWNQLVPNDQDKSGRPDRRTGPTTPPTRRDSDSVQINLPETPDPPSGVYQPTGALAIDFRYSPVSVDADVLADRMQHRSTANGRTGDFLGGRYLDYKVKPHRKIGEGEVEQYFQSGYRNEPWIPGGMYRILEKGTTKVWYDEDQDGTQGAGEGWQEEPYWIWYQVHVQGLFHGWTLHRQDPSRCHHATMMMKRMFEDRSNGGDSTRHNTQRVHIPLTDEARACHQVSKYSGTTFRNYFIGAVYGPFSMQVAVEVHCQAGKYSFTLGNEHPEMVKCWRYVQGADEIRKKVAFYATGRENVAKEIIEAMARLGRGYVEYCRKNFLLAAEDEFELPGYSWPFAETDYDWLRKEAKKNRKTATKVSNSNGGTYDRREIYSFHLVCYEANVVDSKWSTILDDVNKKVNEKPSSSEMAISVNIPGASKVEATRSRCKPFVPNRRQGGPAYYSFQESIVFCIDNVYASVHGQGYYLGQPRLRHRRTRPGDCPKNQECQGQVLERTIIIGEYSMRNVILAVVLVLSLASASHARTLYVLAAGDLKSREIGPGVDRSLQWILALFDQHVPKQTLRMRVLADARLTAKGVLQSVESCPVGQGDAFVFWWVGRTEWESGKRMLVMADGDRLLREKLSEAVVSKNVEGSLTVLITDGATTLLPADPLPSIAQAEETTHSALFDLLFLRSKGVIDIAATTPQRESVMLSGCGGLLTASLALPPQTMREAGDTSVDVEFESNDGRRTLTLTPGALWRSIDQPRDWHEIITQSRRDAAGYSDQVTGKEQSVQVAILNCRVMTPQWSIMYEPQADKFRQYPRENTTRVTDTDPPVEQGLVGPGVTGDDSPDAPQDNVTEMLKYRLDPEMDDPYRLEQGDLIVAINGRPIKTLRDYMAAVGASPTAMKFTIRSQLSGRPLHFQAELRSGRGSRFGVTAKQAGIRGVTVVTIREDYPGWNAESISGANPDLPKTVDFGLSGRYVPLQSEFFSDLNRCFAVDKVKPDTPAAWADLKPGDAIVAIGDLHFESDEGYQYAVKYAPFCSTILMVDRRTGQPENRRTYVPHSLPRSIEPPPAGVTQSILMIDDVH